LTAGIAAMCLPLPLRAASYQGGMSGAWLRPPVGAVAMSMGGAATASPRSLYAWYNPAMIVGVGDRTLGGGIGVRSLGRLEGYGGFAFRIPPRVGMAVALLYRGDPIIKDMWGIDAADNPVKLGTASYTTLTLKTSLAYLINRKLTAGINFSVYYKALPNYDLETGNLVYTSAAGIGGFGLAARYLFRKNLALSVVIKDIGAVLDWSFGDEEFLHNSRKETVLPSAVFAMDYETKLTAKPFRWALDMAGYVIDGAGERLDHPEAVLNSGWEWQYWEHFALRAGIGNIIFNSMISEDSERYFNDFGIRISAGCAWALVSVREGLYIHYAVSSDKVWRAVDQQLDITLDF
jgi:hypothetical protein